MEEIQSSLRLKHMIVGQRGNVVLTYKRAVFVVVIIVVIILLLYMINSVCFSDFGLYRYVFNQSLRFGKLTSPSKEINHTRCEIVPQAWLNPTCHRHFRSLVSTNSVGFIPVANVTRKVLKAFSPSWDTYGPFRHPLESI
ncbi:hypothetical protein ACOSP7_017651 [Xanthoceras sorbifolium]